MKTLLLTAMVALFGASSVVAASSSEGGLNYEVSDSNYLSVYLTKGSSKEWPQLQDAGSDWKVLNVPVTVEAKPTEAEDKLKLTKKWVENMQFRVCLMFQSDKSEERTRKFLVKDLAISDLCLPLVSERGKSKFKAAINLPIYFPPRTVHCLFRKGETENKDRNWPGQADNEVLIAYAVQAAAYGSICKVVPKDATSKKDYVNQKKYSGTAVRVGELTKGWYRKMTKKDYPGVKLLAISETPFAANQRDGFVCNPIVGAPQVDVTLFGDTDSSSSSATGTTTDSTSSTSSSGATSDTAPASTEEE